ncbi:hypothetical protein HRH25_08130 [Flavisolibacter sp. BT320]|nr:hypothetical protein [Flavisolibacter longurius]
MEMRRTCHICLSAFVLCLLFFAATVKAQSFNTYTIKNGRMYVQLSKPVTESSLDSFIVQFDLSDLDLKSFLKSNKADSLHHYGWKIEINNEVGLIISKAIEPFTGLLKNNDKLFFKDRQNPLFPSVNNGLTFGVNRFRNKEPFLVRDSVVRFFLRNHLQAKRVMLAGSFNNWKPDQLSMQKTDSGWIYDIALGAGKWWYKFIVNGNWIVDRDNLVAENDGQGNINSVFFRPNTTFVLPGYTGAEKVFLAGSFNNWKGDGLPMKKTSQGWELPLYIAEGTHTYKFVVDGRWVADPNNPVTVPDGISGTNTVIRNGKPYLFRLNGFTDAKEVVLLGSFNQWRDFEWRMKKTDKGWELPFTLGPGNHEYKFKVDGKLIRDPENPIASTSRGSSFLILHPNYTFRLQNFPEAKAVFLAGDFNQWNPDAFAMEKMGEDWIFPVHLSVGKHLYKYIVDGKWLTDPGNKLWEQNEYGTGNSVLWVEN